MNKKKFVTLLMVAGFLHLSRVEGSSFAKAVKFCLRPVVHSAIMGAGNLAMNQLPTSPMGTSLTAAGLFFNLWQHASAGSLSEDKTRKETNMELSSLALFIATGVSAGSLLYYKNSTLSRSQKCALGFQVFFSFYHLFQNLRNYKRDKDFKARYGE